MYNRADFAAVKAEGLRFINRRPQDTSRHIYKIGVGESLCSSYHLCTVRHGSELHLWLDGKELCTVDLKKLAASRVGLAGGNYFAEFRGVLYYHIGQ